MGVGDYGWIIKEDLDDRGADSFFRYRLVYDQELRMDLGDSG